SDAAVAYMGEKPGDLKWANTFKATSVEEHLKLLNLSGDDAAIFRARFNSLGERINVAERIAKATNVTNSVKTALEAEQNNMLRGIIVFSDGRSNVDVRVSDGKGSTKISEDLQKLHDLAKSAEIPIISIGIGENRIVKSVRVTDLQSPDRTTPDDSYEIIFEADGENMPGASIDAYLEMFPPMSDVPFTLSGKVTFDRGEPPHGQHKFSLNPAELLETLPEDMVPLVIKGGEALRKLPKEKRPKVIEFIEGEWKTRAYTARINENGKADDKARVESELMPLKVEKKPVRILLMCAAPNRDFQFLLNQLVRDKADLSVYVQNDAGMFLEGKSLTYLDDKHRHLQKFPDRLKLEDDANETPENKWLNLARYDVIIAFDPDWSLLSEEQAKMIQAWVDLQAGGLFHVAGPVHTKKMTYVDNQKKLEPLLEVLPVELAEYDLKMSARNRDKPRRLDFPGAAKDMEFLRLDDDDPDEKISGWEPFFSGLKEEKTNAELKRGFYDFYPIKKKKAGATIVARYLEAQTGGLAGEFPYKYGQGRSVFIGSSELWRLMQYKNVFFDRFWVKMYRYLAEGSRKTQNRRGRILMYKTFAAGDKLRVTAQLLDAQSQGIPASEKPEIIVKPIDLESYASADPKGKVDMPPTPGQITLARENYRKSLTRVLRMEPRGGGKSDGDTGFFELDYPLAVEKFPAGTWSVEVKIPNSSESLAQKFTILKESPRELKDVRPDMLALAAISSEVEEVRSRLLNKPVVYDKLNNQAFYAPNLIGRRMAYKFDDKDTLELIPECMDRVTINFENPQSEPEHRRSKIDPRWFDGPEMPRWMTRWYDSLMDQSERTHRVALWMLVCVALLSGEWLTRKLLKLA
ncbi:MAG: VWA domain-containing protein, partial [Planctomycetes bacterium]|nr:VWA domain-containing protein [Planctomycetota bacterium]